MTAVGFVVYGILAIDQHNNMILSYGTHRIRRVEVTDIAVISTFKIQTNTAGTLNRHCITSSRFNEEQITFT